MRARLAFLVFGSAALGGCAYGVGGYGSPFGGLSVSIGSGYGGYGGYGSRYGCYDPYSPYGRYGGYGYSRYGRYGSPYGGYGGYGGYDRYGFPYGGYGYGSCSPYSGWYGGYYYPGIGHHVYDRYRRPFPWSDSHRRYWSERRERASAQGAATPPPQRPDWSGFEQRTQSRSARASGPSRDVTRMERVRTQVEDRRLNRDTRGRSSSQRRARLPAEEGVEP